MIETIIAAFIAFVSTNVDDIFILIALFTQVSTSLTKRDIYIGQFLGIGLLIFLSVLGAWIGTVIPKEYIGLLGLIPIYMGLKKIYETFFKKNQFSESTTLDKLDSGSKFFNSFVRVQILSVAAITIANGGDNVGIYIPFFTALSTPNIILTILIFFALTYSWLTIARYLVYHPSLTTGLKKYQPKIFPIILIALGTYILVKNYTYILLLF